MIVGIVGLGLIGGSLARAYKQKKHTVYGYDLDDKILEVAKMVNVIDKDLDKDTIAQCDCVLIALYPKATIEYLEHMGKYIDKKTVVIDCCGVKEEVCDGINGYIFESNNIDSLKNALRRCISMTPDQYSSLVNSTKDYINTNYSAKAIKNMYLEMFEKVLNL